MMLQGALRLLPGIREQNVTLLAAMLWEFHQLVLDPSSSRTFFSSGVCETKLFFVRTLFSPLRETNTFPWSIKYLLILQNSLYDV